MISRLTVRNKMLVVLLVFSIVPIITFAAIAYNNYSRLIENQTQTIASNIVEHTSLKLNHTLNEIKKVSEFLLYEQTSKSNTFLSSLQKYGDGHSINEFQQLVDAREFTTIAESFLLSYEFIEGIYLFTPSGINFSNSKSAGIKLDFNLEQSPWYQDVLTSMGKLHISDFEVQDFLVAENPSISFSRMLIDPTTRQQLGVLVFNCTSALFQEINNRIVPNSNITIASATGTVLYDNNNAPFHTTSYRDLFAQIGNHSAGRFYSKESKALTVYTTTTDYDWKIIVSMPMENLTEEYQRTQRLVLLFVGMWILLSAVIGMFIANSFSNPIMGIAKLMKKYSSDKSPSFKKYMKRSDEIGILYTQYANMLQQIDTLIKDKYETQIILMSSKMRALEAQINSHFLFNTLETLNSIALIENVSSVSTISKALGDMFRYAIKTKSEFVTLKEELEHVHNYIAIQKFRYANKFDIAYNIEESLLDKKILKLILQPLIENAFYHGIETKKGKGTITIQAHMNDNNHLVLKVEDDGVGIPPEKLADLHNMMKTAPSFEQLNDSKGDKRSIGVYNVHARIALYYGLQYGLSIDSQLGAGTSVTLIVPQPAA